MCQKAHPLFFRHTPNERIPAAHIVPAPPLSLRAERSEAKSLGNIHVERARPPTLRSQAVSSDVSSDDAEVGVSDPLR